MVKKGPKQLRRDKQKQPPMKEEKENAISSIRGISKTRTSYARNLMKLTEIQRMQIQKAFNAGKDDYDMFNSARSPSVLDLNLDSVSSMSLFFFFQYLDMIHDHSHNHPVLTSWTTFMMYVSDTFPRGIKWNEITTFVLDRVKLMKANKVAPLLLLDHLLKIYTSSYDTKTGTFIVKQNGQKEKMCLDVAINYIGMKTLSNSIHTGPNTPTVGALAYDTQRERRKHAMVSFDMSNMGSLKTVLANYTTYIHLTNIADPGKVFMKNKVHGFTKKNTINSQQKIVYDFGKLTVNINSANKNICKYILSYQQQSSKRKYDVPLHLNMHVNMKTVLSTNGSLSKEKSNKSGYKELTSKFMGDFLQVCNCLTKNIYFASGDKMACVGYIVGWDLVTKNNSKNLKLFVERTQSFNISHRIELVSGIQIPNQRQLPFELKHFYSLTPNRTTKPSNNKPCILKCLHQCQSNIRLPFKKRELGKERLRHRSRVRVLKPIYGLGKGMYGLPSR